MRRSLSDTALEGLGALVAEPLPTDSPAQDLHGAPSSKRPPRPSDTLSSVGPRSARAALSARLSQVRLALEGRADELLQLRCAICKADLTPAQPWRQWSHLVSASLTPATLSAGAQPAAGGKGSSTSQAQQARECAQPYCACQAAACSSGGACCSAAQQALAPQPG